MVTLDSLSGLLKTVQSKCIVRRGALFMSQDPHVETRYELTRLFSFPRLMFSRTGVFSWLLQHVVGLVTRSAELFGAKRVADSIRRRRLEAAIEYRTLCEKFFWMSVRSSKF